jgi:DNA polymerase-3 subunit delta
VLDDFRTMTFFGGKRLAIVESADAFVADNKDVLARYTESPSPVGVLVLVCNKKPDGRLKAVKNIEKNGDVVPCVPPKGKRAIGWVRDRARDLDKQMSYSAAQLLVDIVGNDLGQLDAALQMLSTYVGKQRSIGESDVAQTVDSEKSIEIWELMDGIATRDGKAALEALDRLLDRSGQEVARLSLIGTTLLRLRNVKRVMEMYGSADQVSKVLKMHPFAAKKNVEQARKFSDEELARGLRRALEADILIKSNRMEPRVAVEKLIAELCR